MRKFKHKTTNAIANKMGCTYAIKAVNTDTICYLPKDFIENTQDWIEIKEPVFTTADGVDMFAGSVYYLACKGITVRYSVFENYHYAEDSDKRFSTFELAQEYLDFNSPKYSLCEIFGLYNKSIGRSNLIQQLKNLKK